MSRSDDEPRDEFAPPLRRKSLMALATHSGFGHVVAALFKYITQQPPIYYYVYFFHLMNYNLLIIITEVRFVW